MSRNFRIALLLICSLLAAGCEFFLAGAVTGTGVFSYINGNLKRSYQAGFNQAIEACTAALETNDIKIKEKNLEGLSAVIKSEYDGKPISVKISRTDVNITEISVRSGFFGFWDKSFSEQIHGSIEKHLQQ